MDSTVAVQTKGLGWSFHKARNSAMAFYRSSTLLNESRRTRLVVNSANQRSIFFFSSRRRHTRCYRDWSSDCALPISERAPVSLVLQEGREGARDRGHDRDRPQLEKDVHDPASRRHRVLDLRRDGQELRRYPEEPLKDRGDVRALLPILEHVHQRGADGIHHKCHHERRGESPAELRMLVGVTQGDLAELDPEIVEQRPQEHGGTIAPRPDVSARRRAGARAAGRSTSDARTDPRSDPAEGRTAGPRSGRPPSRPPRPPALPQRQDRRRGG